MSDLEVSATAEETELARFAYQCVASGMADGEVLGEMRRRFPDTPASHIRFQPSLARMRLASENKQAEKPPEQVQPTRPQVTPPSPVGDLVSLGGAFGSLFDNVKIVSEEEVAQQIKPAELSSHEQRAREATRRQQGGGEAPDPTPEPGGPAPAKQTPRAPQPRPVQVKQDNDEPVRTDYYLGQPVPGANPQEGREYNRYRAVWMQRSPSEYDDTTTVPVTLVRNLWMFAPTARGAREIPGMGMTVGDENNEALDTYDLLCLLCVFVVWQWDRCHYIQEGSRPSLCIETTKHEMYQVMHPGRTPHGKFYPGVERRLGRLTNTPVVFTDPVTDKRVKTTFLSGWEKVPGTRKIRIYVHPYWSAPFFDKTKRQVKPVSIAVIRENKLRGRALLQYLWADYVTNRDKTKENNTGQLKLSTIFERNGSCDPVFATARRLFSSAAQQVRRARQFMRINGLPTSTGQLIHMVVTGVENIRRGVCKLLISARPPEPTGATP